jgi:hypothetical protein
MSVRGLLATLVALALSTGSLRAGEPPKTPDTDKPAAQPAEPARGARAVNGKWPGP